MKIVQSIAYACKGIKICFASETNFKIHVVAAVVVIFFAVVCNITAVQWMLLLFAIVLVMVMEMINTAIEKLCDLVQPEFHPVIKKVKDIAAGAVLVTAIVSVIIGAVIFLPLLISYFKNL